MIKAVEKRLKSLGKTVYKVAPTGVAAANVGGMTIHTFAGISGSDKPPYSVKSPEARLRIKSADTLIIDEISMVDNHMLPGLDLLCRDIRCAMGQPFGGMQIIAVGDFAQLKPVDAKKKRAQEEKAKAEMRRANGHDFSSNWTENKRKGYNKHRDILTDPEEPVTYCYNSKAWKLVMHKFFILDRIYRQTDANFLRVLNEIREGQLSEEARMILESRRLCNVPGSMAPDGSLPSDYTALYSRREDVEQYNRRMLMKLEGDVGYTYKALDRTLNPSLDFLVNQFPIPESIWMKVGARVMLKKNICTTKGMVNGLRGEVIGFCELFAKDCDTPLFRPIEGCVMPRATADLTPEPLSRYYEVPNGPSVRAPAGCKSGSFCPRKILDKIPLPGSKRDGAELGETDPDLMRYELVSSARINSLKMNAFFPVPVVHFENGEVVAMLPIKWAVEDERKISKKRMAEGEQSPRVELASRVQVHVLFSLLV